MNVLGELWKQVSDDSRPESKSGDFSLHFLDGSVYKVHQRVLAARSGFFRARFSSGMGDAMKPMEVECFSSSTFQIFREILYLGRSKDFNSSRFAELFAMADFFDVPCVRSFLLTKLTPAMLPAACEAVVTNGVGLRDLETMIRNMIADGRRPSPGSLNGTSRCTLDFLIQCNQTSKQRLQLVSQWAMENGESSVAPDDLALLLDGFWFSQRDVDDLNLQEVPMMAQACAEKLADEERRNKGINAPTPFSSHTFTSPCGIAFDPATCHVYVSDSAQHKVIGFDGVTCEPLPFAKFPPIAVARPEGVGLSSDGHIFVFDRKEGALEGFDRTGQCLFIQSAKVVSPKCICVDSDRVLVQDRASVHAFSKRDGSLVESFEKIHFMTGFCVDSATGDIFSVSSLSNEVTRRDSKWNALGTFGHESVRPFSFKSVAIDSELGHVLVTDGSQVHRFKKDGHWVSKFYTGFEKLLGIAAGQGGCIYVCGNKEGLPQVWRL